MQILQKLTLAFTLIIVFASCQSASDVKEMLAKPDTRKATMDSIANDSSMSKEMMTAMMNNKGNKMMLMGNHLQMMKMMKDNPSMMSDMMEICKSDTTMMHNMCKSMMENHHMMGMMQKMKDDKMGMDKMKGMDHKAHH